MDAGTNLPTGWTETGLSTDGIWSTGDAATATSGYLFYPDPITGTNFAYTNDDSCDCNKSADRMILPVQDFTGLSAVGMELDVYLYGGEGETLVSQVSTDGGATWASVATFTADEAAWMADVTVDLSAYGDMANVMISFLYNDAGEWAYGAGIDNLELMEVELLDDLSLVSHTGEYTVIPLSQAESLDLSVSVYNNTSIDLTDIIVEAHVYIDAVFAETLTSTAASIVSGDTNTVTVGSYSATVNGTYRVDYEVSSASITDADPLNDVLFYNFAVNDELYARDDATVTLSLGVNGTDNTSLIGVVYDINEATSVTSLLASHGQLTAGNVLSYEVYDTTPEGLPSTLIGTSDDHVVTNEEETAGQVTATVSLYDLNSNGLYLAPGSYLFAYSENASINTGSLSMTDAIFTPNTVFAQINGGAWTPLESLGFPNTPVLRPILSDCVALDLDMSFTATSCNGSVNGTATVAVTDGTGTYTYEWDAAASSQTTATAIGLAAGAYSVSVTDENGCSTIGTVTVTEPAMLTSSAVDNGNGSATVTAEGGVGGYTYQWDAAAGNQTTATATELSPGSYSVVTTDANGCITLASVTVVALGLDTVANDFNVLLQPNPAEDVVHIRVTKTVPQLKLRIYTITGQLVAEHTLDTNAEVQTVNVAQLQSGIYMMNFKTDTLSETKRLIIK